MNDVMGRALGELVEGVGAASSGPPESLWVTGRRRRLRARLTAGAGFAVVVGLLAFVAWPSLSARPAVPASRPPSTTAGPTTYPSMIAHPWFAPDVSTAHRPMVAVVQSGDAAYAIDAKGDAWRMALPATSDVAELSPDGRWVADARSVTDLLTGTRARPPRPAGPDETTLWARWSPDSAYVARALDPSGTIAVSTPRGAVVEVPSLVSYVRDGLDAPVAAGWVDPRTLLVVWSLRATTSGSATGTVATTTWTIGESSWASGPTLTLPGEVGPDLSSIVSAVSPDGRTLAVSAIDAVGGRHDQVIASFDLSGVARATGDAAGAIVDLGTASTVDGISWRGDELLVTVGGRTGPPRADPVVTSGSGFAGPTSWRADALAGAPYWNAFAIWRSRAVVVAVLLLGACVVWLFWRGGLWAARRVGIVDGPLPLRFDPGWWRRA